MGYHWPMPRVQTMVQLNADLIDSLDALAAERRISRSELIREALADYLEAARHDGIGELIAAGYRRIPALTADEWASVDQLGERGTSEVGQRLDREEREHGLPSW